MHEPADQRHLKQLELLLSARSKPRRGQQVVYAPINITVNVSYNQPNGRYKRIVGDSDTSQNSDDANGI